MAVGTGASLVSQTVDLDTLNREDLLDLLTMISPTDTPFFSMVDKGSCKGTLHEWGTDVLAAAGENHHVEGADATFAALEDRTRLSNYTQIFSNTFSVSKTQEKVDKAGIKSEVAYQGTKKMAEHKLDVEWAIFNNDEAGDDGVDPTGDRQLKSIKAFISATDPDHRGLPGTAAGVANTALIEANINDALEAIWNAGGHPDTIMTSAKIKRKITSFTTTANRTLNVAGDASNTKKLSYVIDVYESDFGTVKIIPNRLIPIDTGTGGSTDVYLLDSERWKIDWLTKPLIEQLAKTGDSIRRWVYSECTLVGKAPTANYVFETVLNEA